MQIVKQIVKPLARRLATAAGATLTTLGMAAPNVDIVVAAIPIVIGFAIDLVISNVAEARGWK
jgi:hypothetical protein